MRPRFRLAFLAALAAPLVVLAGCTTYQDDLSRGQKYYEGNEHERALAVLRALEHDLDSLKPEDRVKYFYYRGMTDYRLASDTYKVRPDARHWLGLAQAGEEETPAALSDEQKTRVKEALDDLARDVYGGADNDDSAKKDDKKASDGAKAKSKKADDDDAPKKKKATDGGDDDAPKKKKKKTSDE
jgi:hypothetical protein